MEAERVFELCRAIAARQDVKSTEKWLYTFLVMNNIRGKGFTRIRVDTIIHGASISERTAQSAMRKLIALGAVKRVVTGRAQIFRFPDFTDWKSEEIVDAAKSAGLTRQKLPTHTYKIEKKKTPVVPYTGPFSPRIGEETELDE